MARDIFVVVAYAIFVIVMVGNIDLFLARWGYGIYGIGIGNGANWGDEERTEMQMGSYDVIEGLAKAR